MSSTILTSKGKNKSNKKVDFSHNLESIGCKDELG